VYIGYLRRKLLPAAGRIAIHTVRGVGYTLTAHLPNAGSR
jgi:DNA-binding response OmpR family regulator